MEKTKVSTLKIENKTTKKFNVNYKENSVSKVYKKANKIRNKVYQSLALVRAGYSVYLIWYPYYLYKTSNIKILKYKMIIIFIIILIPFIVIWYYSIKSNIIVFTLNKYNYIQIVYMLGLSCISLFISNSYSYQQYVPFDDIENFPFGYPVSYDYQILYVSSIVKDMNRAEFAVFADKWNHSYLYRKATPEEVAFFIANRPSIYHQFCDRMLC